MKLLEARIGNEAMRRSPQLRSQPDAGHVVQAAPQDVATRLRNTPVEQEVRIDVRNGVAKSAGERSLPERQTQLAHPMRRDTHRRSLRHHLLQSSAQLVQLPPRRASPRGLQRRGRASSARHEHANPMPNLDHANCPKARERLAEDGETYLKLSGERL